MGVGKGNDSCNCSLDALSRLDPLHGVLLIGFLFSFISSEAVAKLPRMVFSCQWLKWR